MATYNSRTLQGTKIDLTPANPKVKKMLNSAGIYTRSDIQWYTRFARVPVLDPFNNLGPTREYVFFTKPDLHIFESKSDSVLNKELQNSIRISF